MNQRQTDINSSYTNDFAQPIGFPLLNWRACTPPPRITLNGRYCSIEALSATRHGSELANVFVNKSPDSDWTYLPYGPFAQEADFLDWIQSIEPSDDPLFQSVIDKASGRAVGIASYLRIEPSVGVIEVGHIHFSPHLQKTPAATESMFLMMRQVFDELGYRRYEWKCDALNKPSRAAAERLGFQFEGVFRQATMYKGRNRDTAWFSILDSEWPRLKQQFEAWLAPENFDINGQQKRRLGEVD